MKTDPDHELEIERFAARVMARDIPREQLLAELKVLTERLQPRSKGPGRPAGAKTKAATLGVKLARAFFYCEAMGYAPTAAATIVAELYQREVAQVFTSKRDQATRVIEEVRDYLVHDNPLAGGRFATNQPEAYRLLIASIMEFPSDSKGAAEGPTALEVARISMQIARLFVMEDTRSKP